MGAALFNPQSAIRTPQCFAFLCDRHHHLAVTAKTAATRRNLIFASHPRSQWKTFACHPQLGSEISNLDAVEGNFAGLDRRDIALRRQILHETSGREPDRAYALRN